MPVVLALMVVALPAMARSARPYAGMPPSMGDQSPVVINISPGHSSAQIVVPVDKSRIIHFDQSFSRVHVGSGDIAEVVPLSSSTIYLLGKKRGSTNLTITNGSNSVVAVVDVVVTYDVDGLRQHLSDLLPTESVDIQPAGDALVLSGHVSSADHLRTIMAVADRYAPGAVTNLLSLSGSLQVLLEVKFAEVQRSALVNLGLKSLNGAAGNNGIIAPASATTAADGFNTIGGLLTDSKTYFLRGEINALEQSGMVRTLAEPNVVALSGETATFLAGGEFPIPVAQSATSNSQTTTIEYKEFGVGLSFTPTVISSDTINLVLKSEVSALDSTFLVTTNGISVPGLKVRRATTTVELRNGQSFAIAGLIQDDFNDSLKSLPGIGSIPIIGALLRSTNYQRNQTELVVFITVHLVGPGPASNVALPTDRVVPPNAGQILGLGHTEETRPAPPPPPPPPGALNGPPPVVASAESAPAASVTPAPIMIVTPAAAPPPAPQSSTSAAAPTPVPEVAPAPTVSAPVAEVASVPKPAQDVAITAAPTSDATTAQTPSVVTPPVADAITTPVPSESAAAAPTTEAAPAPSVARAPAPVPDATQTASLPAAPSPLAALSSTPPASAAVVAPTPAAEPTAAPAPSTEPPAEPVAEAVAAMASPAPSTPAQVVKPMRTASHVATEIVPTPKPAVPADDDLPVTAPVNVQAALADANSAQPDPNEKTVP